MKTVLLIIVLALPAEQEGRGEQHVAVVMPDEATCEVLRTAFVYAVNIVANTAQNTPVASEEGYVDPFEKYDEPKDVRIPLDVHEVRCEVHEGE